MNGQEETVVTKVKIFAVKDDKKRIWLLQIYSLIWSK